jgi:hypothetical protein
MPDQPGLRPLSEEFRGAQLGDKRRTSRLMKILDSAEQAVGLSLPKQAGGDEAALEGTYRLLGNEQVAPEAILQAHQEATVRRAQQHEFIVVPHDTTTFAFGGTREGLGLIGHSLGMLAHYSLALSPAGEPLGVLGLRVWARSKERQKADKRMRRYDEDRESMRWHEAVDEVGQRLAGSVPALHVMDREGDAHELLADLVEHGQRFVIRVAHNRVVQDQDAQKTELFEEMRQAPSKLEREVAISTRASSRTHKERRLHPPRSARVASLTVRAGTFRIVRDPDAPVHLPDFLILNYVDVLETDPPAGQEAVHWRLVTSEAIETAEQAAAIVDFYRMRWTIEEYFKAIKTGCQFEKLQLESARALVMALAVYSAVAWRLLLVRWMERLAPDAPAALVATSTQLAILAGHQRKIRRPWTAQPTCRDVLLAIAALGGHIRNNGAPGWLVLGRGFHDLLLMEAGALLAQAPPDIALDVINR